ncbi:MAG TPA: hypothetical protein VNT27_00010 [Propionibacteriaceae bacterium]|nr:hypothetical protein [Propionibacteriaceae bacterium]
MSGFLRDATTGAPLHNGCIAWRPASVTSTATNGTTRVGDKGKWSINTGDPGPFYIAFYVTDDGDCSQAVLTGPENYRASWYHGHPFFGTDPHTALPPRDADPVAAGSNVVACLGRNNTLPTACTTPNRTASGRVVRIGNVPIRNACIVALGPDNLLANVAVSGVDGRWKLTGLPINYDYIVGAIPSFQTREGPCGESEEGPPTAPPPGALQPEFYDDTWADLAELRERDDAFALVTDPNSPHPAITLRNNQTGIDFCLTTEIGRDTERSSCDPTPTASASATASASPALAATGGSSPLTPALGVGLLLGASGLIWRVPLRRVARNGPSPGDSDRS